MRGVIRDFSTSSEISNARPTHTEANKPASETYKGGDKKKLTLIQPLDSKCLEGCFWAINHDDHFVLVRLELPSNILPLDGRGLR
jgi:hypothetical protein